MTVLAERPMTISPTQSGGHERERRGELTLAALPSAVTLVRLLVQHDLAEWSFDGSFIRRVEQVAEELAIHAVVTTGIIEAARRYSEMFDAPLIIVVRLRAFGDERVIVEMWDQVNTPPDASLAQKLAVAGADAWDSERPSASRRVVWCTVTKASFPRRPPRVVAPPSAPAAEIDPAVDTGLLHRVLDGLRRQEPTNLFDEDHPVL